MPSLKEEIAERKREEAKQPAATPSCYTRSFHGGGAVFIELRPDAHVRTGFPVSQLCHYTLEPEPESELAAPERLTLAFHTADVVITGARLGKLAEQLREHTLTGVSTLDARYAETLGKEPWVARIVIRPLGKPAQL